MHGGFRSTCHTTDAQAWQRQLCSQSQRHTKTCTNYFTQTSSLQVHTHTMGALPMLSDLHLSPATILTHGPSLHCRCSKCPVVRFDVTSQSSFGCHRWDSKVPRLQKSALHRFAQTNPI